MNHPIMTRSLLILGALLAAGCSVSPPAFNDGVGRPMDGGASNAPGSDDDPTPDPGDDDDAAPPSREVCDNDEDDDLDGLTDCVDPECSIEPACSPAVESTVHRSIELTFLTEYFDDGDQVWRSDQVGGTAWREERVWTGTEWQVQCASALDLTGGAVVPTDCTGCQIDLLLEVVEVVASGCGVTQEELELPMRVGLRSEGNSLDVVLSGAIESWSVTAGIVDWSNWLDDSAWSVQTLSPLLLQAP